MSNRTIVLVAASILAASIAMTGCGSDSTTDSPEPNVSLSTENRYDPDSLSEFTANGDLLEYTDPEAHITEGTGLKIVVNRFAQTATFEFIDSQTQESLDEFAIFNYQGHTFAQQYHTADGQKLIRNASLVDNALAAVYDQTDTDISQTLKDAGTWDAEQTATLEMASAIDAYFSSAFGVTIEQAVVPGQ